MNKPPWLLNLEKLLESIDADVFLEHIDPDWRDRYGRMEGGLAYYDREQAFFDICEHMSPRELIKNLDASGCRQETQKNRGDYNGIN